MKVAGKCIGVAPSKGNALVVTVVNELDGDPHEIDVRCWGDAIVESARSITPGQYVEADGRCETKSWKKDKTDPRPPMRFTNYNAFSIRVAEVPKGKPQQMELDDSDVPF